MNNSASKFSIFVVAGMVLIVLGYGAYTISSQNNPQIESNVELTVQKTPVEASTTLQQNHASNTIKAEPTPKPAVKTETKKTASIPVAPPVKTPATATIETKIVIPPPQSKPGAAGLPGPVISSIYGPRIVKETVEASWDIVVSSPDPATRRLHYSVDWGDAGTYHMAPQAYDESTSNVKHTYFTLGTYIATFSVFDPEGGSASQSFAISVEPSDPFEPIILSISPDKGPVGTTVTLTGTGFSARNNTIHIGAAALLHYTSSEDGKIIFTIPPFIDSYCNPADPFCGQYKWEVGPGKYQLWIENENGLSPNVQLTVTQQSYYP